MSEATPADASAPATSPAARWNVGTVTVVAGLTAGWVLGFGGGIVEPGILRESAWALSSVGIMAAAAVLAVRHAGADPALAAGFVLLALGEAVIHTQGPAAIDAVAAATYAYVPALALVAASGWSPTWSRVTAAAAAVGFAVHAGIYLAGRQPAVDDVAITIAYGLLGVTMIGWTWRVLRSDPSA